MNLRQEFWGLLVCLPAATTAPQLGCKLHEGRALHLLSPVLYPKLENYLPHGGLFFFLLSGPLALAPTSSGLFIYYI